MKRNRRNAALELVTLEVTNKGIHDVTRLGTTFPRGTTTTVSVPRARALEITAHADLVCEETE